MPKKRKLVQNLGINSWFILETPFLDKYLEQFSSGEKKTYPVNMSTWRNVLNLAGTDSKKKLQDEDTGGRGPDELKDEFSSVETRFR